ncbi:uncharacterized protein LOC129774269 [Toxorhynchites rutilus septentrionalis]|uniref:uncharacterized protein LOC129774269 n=1 Tax=Toxorhynchites rutilus septentrionalis TaxID=329112 RepID=UPI00247AD2CE|nr:uncharacterized protein LOC129774269 [Toxorhynchites rutilus septentrionalis]
MFDVILRELNLLLNEALSGNIPPAFVCLCRAGQEEGRRSYRTILLLNNDYKLFSRILKIRLKRVMREHHVLIEGQKCSNSERNIFQATLALKDRIASLRRDRRAGMLISFDLDHAFDHVRHSFLFQTMRSFGFNDDFIALLTRIASRSASRLLINGHRSRSFEIQRSDMVPSVHSSTVERTYSEGYINDENVSLESDSCSRPDVDARKKAV